MSVRAWRIWCEVLGLRPNFTFTLLGGVNPSAGAFKDNAPFKLGNGGEDVKHQLAARCRGVYVLGERTKMHARLLRSSMMAIRSRTLRPVGRASTLEAMPQGRALRRAS